MHAHTIDPFTTAVAFVGVLILIWIGFSKGGFPGRVK